MRFVKIIKSNSFYFFLFEKDNLGNALTMEELDSSNGILFPVYDEDTGLIFLCGKVENCNCDETKKNHNIYFLFRVIQPFDILNIHQKHLIFII
jgi:hypothetical protein